MDLKKIGMFIASSRKEKNMTQKELADGIGVTDKAVSRWETGRGFPDVSILKSLSEVLGMSITEIVNGEKSSPEMAKENADSALLEALNYSKRMSKKTIGIVLVLFGAGFILFPLLFSGQTGFSFLYPVGIVLLIAAIILLSVKQTTSRKGQAIKLSKRFAGCISLAMLLVIVVLEMLPSGVVLIFSDGPDIRIRETYAYFSLTPFGNAHFFPLITASLTVVITLFLIIALIRNYTMVRLQNAAFICTVVAVMTSLLSCVMFGSAYMTHISIAISVLLAISIVFQALTNRQIRSSNNA